MIDYARLTLFFHISTLTFYFSLYCLSFGLATFFSLRYGESIVRFFLDKLIQRQAFRAQQISGSGDGRLVVVKASTSNNNTQQPSRMEAGEALSLKIQCNLSDQAYQMIRNSSLVHNANIYPTLHSLLVEKQNCLPSGMMISETSAFAPLQS